MTRYWWAIVLIAVARTASAQQPADTDFFEAKIRPVLAQRCYGCHSSTQTLLNVVDFGMNVQQAIEAPRGRRAALRARCFRTG